MNNLKKYLFRALLITIGCLFQFSLSAQTTYGIIPFSGGGTCINSDGTSTNTYQIELPGSAPFSSFKNKSFSVSGGIEIASLDTTNGSITIRSRTEFDRSLGYPKYRPGTITFSCEAPEDSLCMACPYYDPHFVYHYTVFKLFDLTKTLNPVVGPICVLEGDTVTYSVEPWVSTGTGATGADNYRWELPTSLVDTILYYSADSSSITFVIDQLTGADTIKTQIGRCNIGDPAKYTWLALNQSAPAPIINDTSCVAGGSHEVQFWVENAQAGLTYTWSCNQPT
ncbi:MAG: hypothetical protein JXA53_08525 [Bacteroidales bacterium]|nr:hypothetical protein [Bacteroidales bacterium]